ncbi:MAG: molybdate ABC transporter substrate-binding protein [Acidobacteria bacterium]|nr:molybdate ABC transporter substrate-binding protein [Acidobacteriota bacterium]
MVRFRRQCVALGVALTCLLAPGLSAQRAPAIAAASDLNFALTEIAAQFERETGQRVETVFGSSGTLARQIQDGAPFELFLSADEAFVDTLAAAGLTRGRGTLYGVGRIALFAPTGSPLDPAQGLAGLARLIERGGTRRFAIANPAHAPYGRAAESALRKQGLWTALQPSLVLGENVSQAAQFATTGNAVGGIIAYSLALAPNLQGRGRYALIPADDHAPLRQRMVLTARAGPVATRFYDYMQTPAARAILERYGFGLPR